MNRRSLCLALIAISCGAARSGIVTPEHSAVPGLPLLISADVGELLVWLERTGDHQGLPVVVVDKHAALLWFFDGRLNKLGGTPVLLGLALGDESVPGIGTKPLAEVKPAERTTPAGRFLVEPGINAQGEDVLWVDYDNAVSMHRLRISSPHERREQRMASSRAADHRITYGCINVPPEFYNKVLHPALIDKDALVYVLPEQSPLALWLDRLGQRPGP